MAANVLVKEYPVNAPAKTQTPAPTVVAPVADGIAAPSALATLQALTDEAAACGCRAV